MFFSPLYEKEMNGQKLLLPPLGGLGDPPGHDGETPAGWPGNALGSPGRAGPRGPERERWAPAEAAAAATLDGRWTDGWTDGRSVWADGSSQRWFLASIPTKGRHVQILKYLMDKTVLMLT